MKTPLAFMHIPKSAGTALINALHRVEVYRDEVHGWDRSLFGSYDEFDTWDQGRRPWMFLDHNEISLGRNFISGHISYSAIKNCYSAAYKFTIIRDPLIRLLSHFLFWRTKPDGIETDVGTYAAHVYSAREPLEHFLRNTSIAPQIDNIAARMLLWPHTLIPDDGFIEDRNVDEIARLSLARLVEFDFTDVYENPEWERNFQNWIGLQLEIKRENETAVVPTEYRSNIDQEMTDDALDLVKARVKIDEVIWTDVATRKLGHCAAYRLKLKAQMAALSRYDKILSGRV